MGNLDKEEENSDILFERYAVYFSPRPEHTLAQCARAWFSGSCQSSGISDLAIDPSWIDGPDRYGFHATLKAPMRLKKGVDPEDLVTRMEQFASVNPVVLLGKLIIARIGSFLALVPEQSSEQLFDFAFSCVRNFDEFRSDLTQVEIARRGNLSPIQNAMLLKWGYPYVNSQFRFHMTLTRSLNNDQLITAEKAARECFAPALDDPVLLDNICLSGDPGEGKPFRLLRRFSLTDTEPCQ